MAEAPNSLISDSLLKVTDLLCEGPISGFALTSGQYGMDPLTSTFFNDVQVRNADGSYNFNISGQGFQFSWTLGSTGQFPMSGFDHVTCQVPLPADTRLSNPLINAGLPKSLLVTFNTSQYPDANSILVSFRIPSMYTEDNAGNVNGFEIDTSIDISLNNGPFTNLGTQQFVGKNTTPYFRTYQFTLPLTTPPQSFYQWTLRMSKTSNDVDSVQTVDDIYVDSVAVISTSQYNYPNSALVGLYIDALQFGTVPSRSYLIQGLLVSVPSGYTPTTYNPNTSTITPAVYPTVWNGTFVTGVWTDNPAWVFYDLASNTRYGLGQYVNTNNIDIWTLYQVAQYCDTMVDNGLGNGGLEPQFALNAFINQPDDAYNMLLNLASAFRGMLYYGNGTIRANITDNKPPVFNYTNANVINGAFNYASTARSARHNACQVKYSDVNNLYRDNYILIEDNQGIIQYGYNKKDITAFGCASVGQATRVANWILTTERLRTETVSFQVGEDGLYVRPGDVFNLYDNFRTNKNQGGRVMSFDSSGVSITLDRPVNLDSGVIYALTCVIPTFNYDATGDVTGSNQIPQIRNPQVQSCMVLNADISGLQTVQVSGGFSGLMKNAVWILSATGSYTSGYIPTVFQQAPQYECLAISDQSPGILNIVALNYNTGINYTVNTGFSVIFNAVNSGNPVAPLPPTNFTGQLVTGALNNQSFYTYLNLTWSNSLSANVAGYVLSGDAGGTYTRLTQTTATGYGYLSPVTGNVDFKIAAVGKGGALSTFQSTSFTFNVANGLTSVDSGQVRFWLLPDGFGDLEQIGVLYNRPSPAITSTNVFYSTGVGAPFRQVLDQSFYAAEGASVLALSATGTTAAITSNSYDMQNMAGQTAIQQANNTLLWLVDNELMSVGAFTGFGNNDYGFSISRGVLGTFAAPHAAQTTGWLFYSADLPSFTDASITAVFNGTGYDTGVATRYFQLQNNTAVLDGTVVPPAPYLSYVIPNPTPQAPTNVVAIVGTGKIVRLTWTAPNNTDILEYRIFRATGPAFTDTALIGTAASVSLPEYDDIAVVLGTTYEYYVTTVAQNEQESPSSPGVFATPQVILPSGINPYPPVDTTALTLVTSGTYLGADGTLYASLTFTVPAVPTGAAYQSILYTKHGSSISGGFLGAQLSNTGGSQTGVTIYDLTPNVSYDVGTQSVSNFGLFSPDIVLGTNSPFLAPSLPATPGGAGSAPNIPSGLVASGGLGGVANFIALSWLPNAELNFEEYGVYRNTINTPPTLPMANVGSNSFMDGNVTGGIQYFYWLSAFNRSEQRSALTPSASAATLGAPSTPSAPTLTTSGFYFSSDANTFSFLTFNVPPLPSGAVGQYLLYRTHSGSGSYTVGNDLSNTISVSGTLNDLTPGQVYDVAIQAYSLNGISTALVTGVASPYPAPSKNTPPNSPTLMNARAATVLDGLPATYAPDGTLQPATVLSWTPSPDIDIAYQLFVRNSSTALPPPAGITVTSGTLPPTVTGTYIYQPIPGFSTPQGFWLSSVDRNGNMSAWTGFGASFVNSLAGFQYNGNMGFQSSTGINVRYVTGDAAAFSQLTGDLVVALTLGSANATIGTAGIFGLTVASIATAQSMGIGPVMTATPQQVLVDYMVQYRVIITGFTNPLSEAFIQVPIPSSAGFSVKPDTCSIGLFNGAAYNITYEYSSADTTSTNAKFILWGNNNIQTGTTLTGSYDFMEYT